ncbi:hypothetical protein C7271_15360 [filamentous cyanobacterium CCP5]|nr:hypothetical protein C7271_15360 [filamentous cyanobacterium CCP5]
MTQPVSGRFPLALLLLRVSVFLVMGMWSLDKFLHPDHASAVFQAFYGLGEIGTGLIYLVGAVQLVIILGFVAGFKKPLTYGLVLLMHGASTFVAFPRYLDPFTAPNLLFFAAWPMLASCFTLFWLRDLDTLWTVDRHPRNPLADGTKLR